MIMENARIWNAAYPPALILLEVTKQLSSLVDGDFRKALVFGGVLGASLNVLGEDREARDITNSNAISVYHLSNYLKLSYSTSQRQVVTLVQRGLCEFGPDGVLVPSRVIETVIVSRAVSDLRAAASRFLTLTEGCEPAGGGLAWLDRAPDLELVRLMVRAWLCGQRLARLASDDDFLAATIFVQLSALTFLQAAGLQAAGRVDGLDRMEGSVSVRELSAALDVSYETVRRQLGRLVAAGVVDRLRNGKVAPAMRTVLSRDFTARLEHAGRVGQNLAVRLSAGPGG